MEALLIRRGNVFTTSLSVVNMSIGLVRDNSRKLYIICLPGTGAHFRHPVFLVVGQGGLHRDGRFSIIWVPGTRDRATVFDVYNCILGNLIGPLTRFILYYLVVGVRTISRRVLCHLYHRVVVRVQNCFIIDAPRVKGFSPRLITCGLLRARGHKVSILMVRFDVGHHLMFLTILVLHGHQRGRHRSINFSLPCHLRVLGYFRYVAP